MEQISKIMESIPPETLENLKKTALGKKDQILREMKKKGIDPKELRDTFEKEKKRLAAVARTNSKKAVLITQGRQLKTKSVPKDFTPENANSVLNAVSCAGMSCSRLCIGSLSDKTIKIWYDPNVANKNKRATNLVGFEVGGSLLIVSEDGDITEEEILEVEKLLC